MEFFNDILEIAIYSCLGVILMVAANFLIDLIIPCSFPEEIKKGNKAVGFVSAGINSGVGILLRAAIYSPSEIVNDETLFSGILSSVLYFSAGIIFFMLGYIAIKFVNRKYELNEEIGKGNTAAGIMVAGIFTGIAILISGVIM
jgi:putative membrane protein